MQIENRSPHIFILYGKAQAGKDSTANAIINNWQNKKILKLHYSKYIKDYTKNILSWNGEEQTKPREFLQKLGTEVIRNHIDNNFFTNRIIEDIKVYSYFFDILIICDARTIHEIEKIEQEFLNQTTCISIKRPNFENGLTESEKNHCTELELASYDKYDYQIINDQSLKELERKVISITKEVII